MSKKEETVKRFLLASTQDRIKIALEESNEEELQALLGINGYKEYVELARNTAPILREHLSPTTSKNLIFVPGVMGSYLKSNSIDSIWWLDIFTVNNLDNLRLASNGIEDANPDYKIIPCSTHPSYEPFKFAVLRQEDFGLETFPYDWRKPINLSSALLKDKIYETYASNGNKPVHLVAHSMGGLIVRATLMNYGQELWSKIGRIVFLGTPHYGSPAIASYVKKHLWGSDQLWLLAKFIGRETFRSLWGVLELLPAPLGIYPDTRQTNAKQSTSNTSKEPDTHPCANFDMYQAENWELGLTRPENYQLQKILDEVLKFHQQMYKYHMGLEQRFRDRMVVIAGVGFKTPFRINYEQQFFGLKKDISIVKDRIPGNIHREGDRSVPLASATLNDVGDIRYVKGQHGALTNIREVYEDVFRWLNEEDMKLPKNPQGALAPPHLSDRNAVSESPHLDGSAQSDSSSDDSGLWKLEPPSPERMAELQSRLEAGQLPEFGRVSLL
jgi:hypothetical protein